MNKKLLRNAQACRPTKCVPFLLVRSSFRGLNNNMASEENALERQEKQICLRAPAVPLLGTCLLVDLDRATHTETQIGFRSLVYATQAIPDKK